MILSPTRAARERTAPLRAVAAVVALYAFVLHAVLGGLAPLPSAVDHGVLCIGQVEDQSTSKTGIPDAAHHGHPPCCTVPGFALGALAPASFAQVVFWPPRDAILFAWRSAAPVWPRGPPGTIAHPRGPPIV